MDIGSVAAWIQIGIWVFLTIGWLRRTGKAAMSKGWLFSNISFGIVVVLGFVMAGISLYFSYTVASIPKELTLNISAYQPPYTAPLKVVSDEKFEDQDVPLDGLIYEHCTFINVCFMYDGGAYGLHNSVVKDHWKICAKEQRLNNYFNLTDALKLYSPRISRTHKTEIVR